MQDDIEFIGTVLHQTKMAILFQEESCTRDEAVWLPISQLTILNEDEKTKEIEMSIPEWLAIEKEMV